MYAHAFAVLMNWSTNALSYIARVTVFFCQTAEEIKYVQTRMYEYFSRPE